MKALAEDEIMQALFGRTNGGAPKQIREHLGFAADAIISIVVCGLIGLLLSRLEGDAFGSGIPAVDPR